MKWPTVTAPDLAILGIEQSALSSARNTDILRGVLVFTICTLCVLFFMESPAAPVAVGGAAFAGGWCATRTVSMVRREAGRNRVDLELATAVFLELVNVMIAGGAGVETAVKSASEAGDGSGFSQLRIAIMRAHGSRTSYWESMATLGRETGVDCLVEVAHTMQLAGESGARVRISLVAKASALRKKNLARVELAAEQSTEKMGLPLVVLFIGFLGLVGFPAFSQAMSAM